MSELHNHLEQFFLDSSKNAGAFSESDSINLGRSLSDGRSGQSPHKNWLLLAFAKRVVDGYAKPHETAFMTALMAADIPSRELEAEVWDVANTISFIDCIDNMQNESLIDTATHMKGGE